MTTQVKAQHTAGPWRVEADKVGTIYEFDIVGPKGEDIGYANRSDGADEPTFYPATENARLMAAAPDLLAACKSALGWYGLDGDGISDPTLAQLRAAIAKAEGQP